MVAFLARLEGARTGPHSWRMQMASDPGTRKDERGGQSDGTDEAMEPSTDPYVEDALDEALEESFPASDPISLSPRPSGDQV